MSAFNRVRQRLARDRRNGWLGGVCAGIAGHFNTEPAFFRVGFVVACLFAWKLALVVYAVAWILLPPKNDSELAP